MAETATAWKSWLDVKTNDISIDQLRIFKSSAEMKANQYPDLAKNFRRDVEDLDIIIIARLREQK